MAMIATASGFVLLSYARGLEVPALALVAIGCGTTITSTTLLASRPQRYQHQHSYPRLEPPTPRSSRQL